MPIRPCQNEGRIGQKWGESGVCYTGKNARKKALRQGIAVEIQKRRAGGSFNAAEFSDIPQEEFIAALAESGLETIELALIMKDYQGASGSDSKIQESSGAENLEG